MTEDFVGPDGRSVNVYGHFHFNPALHDHPIFNYFGLSYSAQLAGPNYTPDQPRLRWLGYDDVWIPVNDQLSLAGKLGLARRQGEVVDADCVVILPGLLGCNETLRTRDLADALRDSGIHALALEPRGHGRMNDRYADVYYTFGVLETCDLMAVSEWLDRQPHIRRTGLIGFCWGANMAILAAWYDNRSDSHPSISSRLAPYLRPVSERKHFEAGVIAISPVVRFEEVLEAMETPWTIWQHPVLSNLQHTVLTRERFKGHPNPSGSLRKLIEDEFARSVLNYRDSIEDALDFVRLWPHRGRTCGDKFAAPRVPLLIVHAANDPLAPAQDVADLFARVTNPNVAGIILPSGGHVGFAAYNCAYYFSLILNFFNAQTGPVPEPSGPSGQAHPEARRVHATGVRGADELGSRAPAK